MRVALASDHAGHRLKTQLAEVVARLGHQVLDLGTDSTESVDYPDFGFRLARAVAAGDAERGIAICGSGIGMSMVANRVPGVRAARCCCEWDARFARLHNDANVITLGERVTGTGLAEAIVETFLSTDFEGGRHARRVRKIDGAAPEGA
ncbi:MAG: ribose 5-phosphate isomerase B [Acidobacteria bacterium]|nr:MAG: ribose 5-phosphate isomerase B [Acidobacteriota bacterium]